MADKKYEIQFKLDGKIQKAEVTAKDIGAATEEFHKFYPDVYVISSKELINWR